MNFKYFSKLSKLLFCFYFINFNLELSTFITCCFQNQRCLPKTIKDALRATDYFFVHRRRFQTFLKKSYILHYLISGWYRTKKELSCSVGFKQATGFVHLVCRGGVSVGNNRRETLVLYGVSSKWVKKQAYLSQKLTKAAKGETRSCGRIPPMSIPTLSSTKQVFWYSSDQNRLTFAQVRREIGFLVHSIKSGQRHA